MQYKLQGIILSSVKVSDSGRIINIYTDQLGKQAFFLRTSSKKKNRNISAFIHALSIVDFDSEIKDNRNINYIGEISISYHFDSLTVNPYKGSIAFFLAEILDKTLKEEEKNAELWSFLNDQIRSFDGIKENISVFHLSFLAKYTRYLGITPDIVYSDSGYLDQSSFFNSDQAELFEKLKCLDYSDMEGFKINWQDRISFLEKITMYYKIKHDIPEFKTHTILKDLFSQIKD